MRFDLKPFSCYNADVIVAQSLPKSAAIFSKTADSFTSEFTHLNHFRCVRTSEKFSVLEPTVSGSAVIFLTWRTRDLVKFSRFLTPES